MNEPLANPICRPVAMMIFPVGLIAPDLPANAIVDEHGNPIVDENGNYILDS